MDLTACHILDLSHQFVVRLVQMYAEVMWCGRSALVM